ncbi:acyl-CoA dehydrogenase family protein [Shimia thalassica]|uniref:acyl-CoA dehydrogenase family protein n=1 Tax=Shimia thalassica TaxID=1715693 RepID=UPI0027334BC5|nr:acyl-CoA dehydrogenase family protein [Shimia thalassica]MDP2580766.1 acyl-CoA dehydrogenase family protein [Shimia thalassica]
MKNPFETEETAAFRETVRRFVEAEITPFVDQWDEAGEIPWALHQKVGALGVFGFGVSEDYGGMGGEDAFLRAAFNEEMAKCGAGGVLAALGGRVISIGPIHDLANVEIKDRILADIVAGRKGSALGITEPSGGSDVANLKTTARKDGNHYVLNGSKAFITGGMTASHFVVGARTGGPGLAGISLFLVDAEADGFSRTALERKMGWWASDQASLFFDDCRVPATNMLGEENRGFLAIMNNFNFERIAMIAQCIGMMKVCLEESISWAQERETFGKKLIKAQVIRHKIAEISVRIDTCEAYLRQICWAVHNADMPVAEISKAKFHTSKALEFCASEAMQIVGGAAYLRGHPVERIYREVKVMAIGGGSEEIMRDLAVRQMGL